MKYVVTGGAGFIGSNLVEELVRQGEDVIVIDNLCSGRKELLRDVLDKIKFVRADIRDLAVLKKEFGSVDFVLHQAALISVTESVEKPELYRAINLKGTRNVLEAARHNDVKKVVFASSCAVYGNTSVIPQSESLEPNPLSPYATFKLEGEELCREYYEEYGLRTTALRYFNVFGPGQNPESEYAGVIPLFIKRVLENKRPVIYGDGEQTRDFVFVKDVVNANLLACKAKTGLGEAINIGSGRETSVNQVLKLINKHVNKSIKPRFLCEREGELRRSCSDNSKAERILGYRAEYGFEEGLRTTIKWVKNQRGK